MGTIKSRSGLYIRCTDEKSNLKVFYLEKAANYTPNPTDWQKVEMSENIKMSILIAIQGTYYPTSILAYSHIENRTKSSGISMYKFCWWL